MRANRREFILGAAALGLTPGAFAAGAPRLRFGVLADIHINKNKWNRQPDGTYRDVKFRRALEVFRDAKVDAVMCCGDLADFGLADELQIVADTWYEVFPDNRRPDGAPVVNLFHYGDHDMSPDIYKRLKTPADNGYRTWDEFERQLLHKSRKAAWEKCFKEPWAPIVHKNVKGCDFVLCNFTAGEPDNKWGNNTPGAEAFLAKLNLPKDKPFFYSQHRVYRGTTGLGKMWGQDDGRSTKLLSAYPNCIAFCGHAHTMFSNEDNIWQGGFTAIEVPSLNYLGGIEYPPYRENGQHQDKNRKFPCQMPVYPFWQATQGYVVDVFDDRVVVNRMDVDRNEPVASAWVIPLPSPGTSPFDVEKRKAAEVAPAFPADAKVAVSRAQGKDRSGTPTDQVTFAFLPARSTDRTPRAYDYVVRLVGKDRTVEKRVFAPNHFRPESQETKDVTCVFAAAELPSSPFDVEVRPASFFGKEGRVIHGRMP